VVHAERPANALSQAVCQVQPAAAVKTAEVHELTVSWESESDATWAEQRLVTAGKDSIGGHRSTISIRWKASDG
jgi:hypothetical protein